MEVIQDADTLLKSRARNDGVLAADTVSSGATTGDFTASRNADSAAWPDRSAPLNPPADGAGSALPLIDGYQITGRLGEGGMGTVWRAWQLSTRREVALKLLGAGIFASERARRRFDREVELTGRLQHPHIARIYDSGVHQGAYFYAMELVEGIPLDHYVNAHRLQLGDVLRLVKLVCVAVQHAHQRGVIHRDLKPSNILVDAEGQPHVLDFGLAKTSHAVEAGQAITFDGEVAGTPAYMSPEQACGRLDQLDTRTDVYSLGVILYQLLSGRHPHGSDVGHLELMRRIAESDVRRPDRRSVDRDLEAVLLTALAREPDQRYPSAGPMAADLDRYLRGDPVSVRAPTLLYVFRKRARREWRRVLAVTLAVLMVVGSAVAIGAVARDRDEARSRETVQQREKEKALHEADKNRAQLWLAGGDRLASGGRWPEARCEYWQAHDLWATLHEPTWPATLALTDRGDAAPLPLLVIPSTGDTLFAVSIPSQGPHADAVALTIGRESGLRRISLTGPSPVKPSAAEIGQIRSAGFSTDGRFAAVIRRRPSGDRRSSRDVIELIDVESHQTIKTISTGETRQFNPIVSSHGRYVLFVASPESDPEGPAPSSLTRLKDRKVLHIWDTASSIDRNLCPVAGTDDMRMSAFAPTGSKFATLSFEGDIVIWDAETGNPLSKVAIQGPRATAIAWSADGDSLIAGDVAGGIGRVKPGSTRTKVLSGNAIVGILPLGDGLTTLVLDDVGRCAVVNSTTGGFRAELTGHLGQLRAAAAPGAGGVLATADANGTVRLWSVGPRGRPAPVVPTNTTITSLSPDGSLLLVAGEDRILRVFDVFSGQQVAVEPVGDPIRWAGFVAGGREAVALTTTSNIVRYDLVTGDRRIAQIPDAPTAMIAAVSPDGGVALVGTPSQLAYHSLMQPGLSKLLPGPVGGSTVIGFSADARLAVVAGAAGSATLFEMATGNVVGSVQAESPKSASVTAAAFAPDGALVLLGDADGILTIAQVGKDTPLLRIRGHAGAVTAVTFLHPSPHGASGAAGPHPPLAVTAGMDGTVRVWDTRDGREIRTLDDPRGLVSEAPPSSRRPTLLAAAAGSPCLAIIRPGMERVDIRDLTKPIRMRALQDQAAAAGRRCVTAPLDFSDYATLGAWCGTLGADALASQFFEKAAAGNVNTHPSDRARARWRMSDVAAAHAWFALEAANPHSTESKLRIQAGLRATREAKPISH